MSCNDFVVGTIAVGSAPLGIQIISGGTISSVLVNGNSASQVEKASETSGVDDFIAGIYRWPITGSPVDIKVNIGSGKTTRGCAITLFGLNTTSAAYKTAAASNSSSIIKDTTISITGLTGTTSMVGFATFANHLQSITWTGATAVTNINAFTFRMGGAIKNDLTGSTHSVTISGGSPSAIALAFWN